MQTKYLFPNSFKVIGWLITISSLILGIIYLVSNGDFTLTFLTFRLSEAEGADLFLSEYENFTNELIAILLIIGLNLVAFSKEKLEDEWVARIRLESLQWGVYFNSLVLILAIAFIYGNNFLDVMIYNLFTVLVFFIIRFHYIIYIKPMFENKNKINAL
jgi:amino acid permease